ncbi:MAG: asparagine synthase (glutamine-hydrolyzing) [Acidimicrobiales bacterium]
MGDSRMCGIVGVASSTTITTDPALVDAMRDSMRHRGPDDAGTWWDLRERLWMAQRRLAILDLSPAGAQPMHDSTGSLHLVFNGEMYNHRALRDQLRGLGHSFRSSCDTEVLLEAYRRWGVDCLDHLNGMYAFALFDSAKDQLFLARDPAGEKPLFLFDDGSRLMFASELKALLTDPSLPRRVDLRALNHYLTYGYVPRDQCILDGFSKLEQGQAMVYDLADGSSRRWYHWRLPASSMAGAPDEAELVDELESLLTDSVRLRLDADVPVGILLSGGVDSSLVTAVAAGLSSSPPKTFTVVFPGVQASDEGPYARIVARHFGTDHTELPATDIDTGLVSKMARQFDEPMADSSMLPTYLLSRLIRAHATVAVGGDGGDELFGGYPHHRALQRYQRLRRAVPAPVRAGAASVVSSRMDLGQKGRNYVLALLADEAGSLAHVNVHFDARHRRQLLGPLLDGDVSAPEAGKARLYDDARWPLPHRLLAVDFQTYLVDDILVKVDRSSMLASLELRSPFLDRRIIDFAFSRVPSAYKATAAAGKVLPRLLARKLLPPELELNRKQGFSLPLDAWFRAHWGPWAEEVLLDSGSVFQRGEVKRLLALQRQGRSNAERIYALVLFELWRREYGVEVSSGRAADMVN